MEPATAKVKTARFRSAAGKAAQNKKAKERKRLRDAKEKAEKEALGPPLRPGRVRSGKVDNSPENPALLVLLRSTSRSKI